MCLDHLKIKVCVPDINTNFIVISITDARYFETLERAEKIPHVLADIPRIEKRSVLRSLYENCYCGLCQCCDS